MTGIVLVPETFYPLKELEVVSEATDEHHNRSVQRMHVLHLAFCEFFDGNGLCEDRVDSRPNAPGLRTHFVDLLRFEDVLHDLVVYEELVFMFCVHLDARHRYIAYPHPVIVRYSPHI